MFSIPYKHNNNNTSKSHYQPDAHNKHIYQMHYVPKLTDQILADSDITENGANQDSSRYEYIVNKWGSAIRDHRDRQEKDDRRPHTHLKEKIHLGEGAEDIGNLSMKIRYGIEYFITSIGNQESISPKLQFAIENLLLHMLNIANTLSRMVPPPTTPGMDSSVRSKTSQIHAIHTKYKEHKNDYYRDEYEDEEAQPEGMYRRKQDANSIRIQDDEQESQSDGNVIAEESSSREESMSGTGEVDVHAFNNSQQDSNNNSNSSSQYYHNTSNQALIKFLNINPILNPINNNNNNNNTNTNSSRLFNKPVMKQGQSDNPYGRQFENQWHRGVNQVDYDEVYTENESEIGVEEPSSTSIMLPENFVKKCDYYSASCQPPRPPNAQQLCANKPKAKEDQQESSDIECSISEYYIEESPCSKASSKKSNNKQNKYPFLNSRNFKNDIGDCKSKYDRGIQQEKSKASREKLEGVHDGFTYSEVVSRKKIF